MIQLFVYVPESHLEEVKSAMFAAGAGGYGRYEKCAWQVIGQGQFMPLKGSHPSTGEINKTAHVNEYKVETICSEANLERVVKAMKQAHPYEEPAYGALTLLNV
jgi:hypothetical protein